MYKDTELENELKYSHTIDSNQAVWAEWNMNSPYNIKRVGNYRYRPGSTDTDYSVIRQSYEEVDPVNESRIPPFKGYYTDATDSDVTIAAGIEDDNITPVHLTTKKEKINLLYSLDDCFKSHRPRSGINKILYLGAGQYIDALTNGKDQTLDVSRRPRYYMASRYDQFKYWTSYRSESVNNENQEYGVSLNQNTGTTNPSYYIYDANPFVVYNEVVPANRVVVKMQTNVGNEDAGTFRIGNIDNFPDPLYGLANRTVPRKWSIQYLDDDNNWVQMISFSESQTRSDGSPIINADGYVEIEYGLKIPSQFSDNFTFIDTVYSESLIPDLAPYGYAYLYKESELAKGTLFISDGGNWLTFNNIEYAWSLSDSNITKNTNVVKDFTNPDYFVFNSKRIYREFQFIKGLRIVVETMNKPGCTFDLIELSPRIVADMSNKLISYSVNKILSDLGTTSMPTGNLLASTGSVSLFDEDGAFNTANTYDYATNTGSIISKYCDMQIKFMFYDIVKNINGYDYYIPVKTLYSEKIPQTSDSYRVIDFELRDLFLLFESMKSPEMLLTNVSLSYAIMVLLDNIGFSNYSFKRTEEDSELIIPFFFVGPNQNIAETLQQLAISSHSAMFFDEENNFIVMSKNYLLPSSTARPTDLVLYGQEEIDAGGIALPNVINLSSQEKRTYNGGEINYTTRYIQKTIGSIAQAAFIDEYKQYVYKPVLLWEVAGQESTKTINEATAQNSGYSLAAMPLKTTLSSELPTIGYEVYTIISKQRISDSNPLVTQDTVILKTSTLSEVISGDYIVVSGVGDDIDGTWLVQYIDINNSIIFQTPKYGNITEQAATGTLYDANMPINNNIIDFGENIYWLGNYSGYFYANGEVIKYDAVEYSVAGVGNVWITNNQQYQEYFSKLRFNGKIYPTGRVRIYTNITNNIIKEHGRGQFGTNITEHHAGVAETEWVSSSNVRGIIQNSKDYLFNTSQKILYPTTTGIEEAGTTKTISGDTYTAQSYADKSARGGIIKNFMANSNVTELDVNYSNTVISGSVQSSALVFTGPTLPSDLDPADFVTYSYKPLSKPYRNFGTRMRIIGKIESGGVQSSGEKPVDQQPFNAFNLYSSSVASTDPSKQVSISGGGGGLAFNINQSTNIGYYFEIDALSQNSISSYSSNSNSVSYEIKKSPVVTANADVITVTLSTKHDFEVGDSVIISGIVDDSRKTKPTAMNGEYAVTEISQDRKMFKYKITPLSTVATISNSVTGGNVAVGDGKTITYTANNHEFVIGNRVTITGFTTTNFNKTDQVITAVGVDQSTGKKTFTITPASNIPNATLTTASGETGTATYLPLNNVIATTGGTVVKELEKDTLISNVFFYKLVSGKNDAIIVKKERVSTTINGTATKLVTLTTLRNHDFQVGEKLDITGVDSTLNGSYDVYSIPTSNSFTYLQTTGANIAETELTVLGSAISKNVIAIPEILWRGFAEILVDDGKFTGQSRLMSAEKSTVYDLSVEYLDIGSTRQFYLYLNDKQIATVTDKNPLPLYNNMALFVRGSSKCMFENVFALSDNFSINKSRSLQLPISQVFSDDDLTESKALSRYALSGIVQNTYLSGISSEDIPQYDIYYEEFGTIMREAAYFNIKYDRAFPALYASLAKTLNKMRGYTISGFYAGSYGAEFLIFNAIDKNLNLDDTSGNYLRILGIAFTQNTTHTLRVDDFFKKNSNFVNNLYSGSNATEEYQRLYSNLLNSRNKYGNNDFIIQAEYIQTDAAAEEMMEWIIKKTMYPRITVGLNTFATPHLQLGDVVTLNIKDSDNIDMIADTSKRFVVYNIEYQKNNSQSTTTVHLAEV